MSRKTPAVPQNVARVMARECLAFRTRRVNRVVTRIYDDALREFGLTAAQLNLLVAVAMHETIQQTELGRFLDLEKSTLSRNIQRMLQNHWLRTTDVDGRRFLSPSKQGEALLKQVYPAWQAAQQRARELFGDSVATIEDMAAATGRD